MIEKIIENMKNNKITSENIQEILKDDNQKNEKILHKTAYNINNNNIREVKYESDMHFPVIYQVINNCPTCGYRTPESKRQYNIGYIESVIKYELEQIKRYHITSINCYNKANYKYNQSDIIFETLMLNDIDKNVKIYDIDDFSLLNYDFNKVIINPENTKVYDEAINNPRKINNKEIVLELNIDDRKIGKMIENLNNLEEKNIHSIQLKGYDPFIDVKDEYHPQYTKEYLLKIICILRIVYPQIELKIQHATNNNNHYDETLKLGINTITGVYANKNNILYNVDEVIQ